MRMPSQSSTGLLPASYSRRRRNNNNNNRPNDASMYEEIPSVPTTPSNYSKPSYSYYYDIMNNDASGGGGGSSSNPQRRTTQNFTSIYSSELLPMSNNYYNKNSGGKNSDDENDENDQQRNNNNRLDLNNSDYDSYDDGYEDVLDKPPKLSDFVINDSCYQRYLLEGKRARYRGIKGGIAIDDNNKGIMDSTFLAKVCAISSCIGMLFLIWVSIMMEIQPLYIKGVSPKPNYYDDEQQQTYRFRKETSNALKAAAAYFLTMVLSLIYLQVKEMNLELLNPAMMGRLCHLKRLMVSTYFRWRRRHYDDIPDNNHSHSYSYGGSSDVLPLLQHRNTGDDGALKSRRINNTHNHNRRRKKGSERVTLLHSGVDGGGGGERGIGEFWRKLFGGGGGSKTKRKKDT